MAFPSPPAENPAVRNPSRSVSSSLGRYVLFRFVRFGATRDSKEGRIELTFKVRDRLYLLRQADEARFRRRKAARRLG